MHNCMRGRPDRVSRLHTAAVGGIDFVGMMWWCCGAVQQFAWIGRYLHTSVNKKEYTA